MATAVIFGAGVMGSAISFPLTDKGHSVRLVGTHLDGDILDQVKTGAYHPGLKTYLPAGVEAFEWTELERALEGADFILSGVNSYGVRWSAETLAKVLRKPLPIIAVTKGLEAADNGDLISLTTVYEKTLSAAGGPACSVSAIGGPCIAGELAARRHSCVVFASENRERSRWFADLFRTRYYHIWPSAEVYPLEIAVALKNAYTLPVGIAGGLLERPGAEDPAGALMHNPAAAVFGQGISEMKYLTRSSGYNDSFASSLPGAGDYYVTCAGGRNMRLGRLLGSGKSMEEALREMQGITIESLSTIEAMAQALPRLEEREILTNDRLPLLNYLIRTVREGSAGPLPFEEFFPDIRF
jgi:glycerol-3-phosphate dehydrogenase (NAD(P)+)